MTYLSGQIAHHPRVCAGIMRRDQASYEIAPCFGRFEQSDHRMKVLRKRPRSDRKRWEKEIANCMSISFSRKIAPCAMMLLALGCNPNPSIDSPPPLAARYHDLAGAVAMVVTDTETGTGFFIDTKGTLMTAAHVVFKRTWTIGDGKDPALHLAPYLHPHAIMSDGSRVDLDVDSDSKEAVRNAGYDIAILKGKVSTPISLILSDNTDLPSIGAHVISIGYPAASSRGSQVLSEGFVSSIFSKPLVLGLVEQHPDEAVLTAYALIQMQIFSNPGVSGAPIIDDSDHVIAIEEGQPVNFPKQLGLAINGFKPNDDSDLALNPNIQKAIGELGWSVWTYFSPGAAIATPIFLRGSQKKAVVLVEVPQAASSPSAKTPVRQP